MTLFVEENITVVTESNDPSNPVCAIYHLIEDN